jgi:ABC-2 type transport system permease protein
VLAVMFCTSGLFFFVYNMAGGMSSLSYLYNSLFTVVLLVIPFLTMRLFSEEKRQKTDQALFTAPTGLTGIVLGKFFAALALFALSLGITLVYALVIAMKVTPDWMVIAGNFLGLLLVGGMMISIGLLISSLTESQVIAALGTLAVSVILLSVNMLSSIFASITWLKSAIEFISISSRYTNFTVGLIEYDNIIFFLSLQALFIFITVRVLDSRRWK